MEQPSDKIPEITISYTFKSKVKVKVFTSMQAYEAFKTFFPVDSIELQERFCVMFLRSQNVLGIYVVSIGGMTSTVVDVRLILSVALKTASTCLMLCHNHPSGTLKPSQQDITLTSRLKEACILMDIKLLDHLIVNGDGQYLSFSDEGML